MIFPISITQWMKFLFGERNIKRIENTFEGSYVFNNKMGVNLRVRHFWTTVDYTESMFFLNKETGGLEDNPYNYTGLDDEGNSLHDINYNAFNIDFNFNWQIAPGSFVTVNWKVIQSSDDRIVNKTFFRNFNDVLRNGNNQNFSVRVLYFIDYLDAKRMAFKNIIDV